MRSIWNGLVLALMLSAVNYRAAAAEAAHHNDKTLTAEYWWHTTPTNLVAKGTAKRLATAGPAVARPAFQWQQIESTNYVDYVKNLSAIGCPPQTLRDIVSADVIQAYAPLREEAMAARYREFQFWKADPEAMAELARQRRVIDGDVDNALKLLLGTQFITPSLTAEWKAAELDQQLRFLAEDKREQTLAVLLRYAEVDVQIKQLADGHRKNEDLEELQQLVADNDQKRATLASFLTPEEFERVYLTCSWTAHNLRRAMTHFKPTEAEFRGIFRIWLDHDEKLARIFAAGERDPGKGPAFKQVQEFLGPQRYQQYRSTWWE